MKENSIKVPKEGRNTSSDHIPEQINAVVKNGTECETITLGKELVLSRNWKFNTNVVTKSFGELEESNNTSFAANNIKITTKLLTFIFPLKFNSGYKDVLSGFKRRIKDNLRKLMPYVV